VKNKFFYLRSQISVTTLKWMWHLFHYTEDLLLMLVSMQNNILWHFFKLGIFIS